MITFVTGGQASGKSDYALGRFLKAEGPSVFIATGKAMDDAFRRQIAEHRYSRPPEIPVVEAGTDLAGVLAHCAGKYRTLLLDCLDYWYFEILQEGQPERRTGEFLTALDDLGTADILIVSSETGLCPVAGDPLTRSFVRGLGKLNRLTATKADEAYLVASGYPLTLKQGG